MNIYNTFSKTIEEIVPLRPPLVTVYACGPTVYDYVHIGHLRKYAMDDILVHMLKYEKFSVKHVENITDVGHLVSDADEGEDKMEKGARKYGKSVWDLAHEFEAYFWKSMQMMNIEKPDVSCRATDHIAEQISLIQTLEKKGFTYIIDGNGVYFDTSKFSSYGALAKLDLDHLKAGARVEMVEGKKLPTDFALWKFSPKDEKRQMEWQSPWGVGFPGWHIECSAMSMKYLGEQIDIHTGGIDHIPVHHTNEIAQSEAATGKVPFVKYWVHHNFLRVEGQKMSKSLGNFYTIDDVISRKFSPMALKLLFLGAHYRSELNFTWKSLESSQKSFEKLLDMYLSSLHEEERTVLSEDKLKKIDEMRRKFFSLMNDDLKTPEAVAVIWEVLKSNIPGGDKVDLLREFDEVLGLSIDKEASKRDAKRVERSEEKLPDQIQELVTKRLKLKEEKKYEQADKLRKELEENGYMVVDKKDGTSTAIKAFA